MINIIWDANPIIDTFWTDIRAMNGEAVHASPRKTGIIILGGGLPKHHICNANMMRNGADYAVFINTAQEFDGSDSGAHPDEAVSWGKIRGSAKTVKVWINFSSFLLCLCPVRFCYQFQISQLATSIILLCFISFRVWVVRFHCSFLF